jgi:hypothetical protein
MLHNITSNVHKISHSCQGGGIGQHSALPNCSADSVTAAAAATESVAAAAAAAAPTIDAATASFTTFQQGCAGKQFFRTNFPCCSCNAAFNPDHPNLLGLALALHSVLVFQASTSH